MSAVAKLPEDDTVVLSLAREIAMGLHELDAILEKHSVSQELWAKIQKNAYFQRILASELEVWNGTLNTAQRAQIKAASAIEEWLPEAFRLAHDNSQTLPARVELMKLVRMIAGVGTGTGTGSESVGERFSVTINLGADKEIRIDKVVTSQVIDGDVLKEQKQTCETPLQLKSS